MKSEIQKLYQMIFEQVSQLGEVRDTDKVVIERLAFNIYTVQQCEEQLLREGFTTTSLHGVREHPAVAVKNKAEAKIREAMILLGLDFSSQLKKKASDSGKNDWSDFL
ncbi:P27 family predicted phage terminase small subunit [Bacillus sp. SLBN-46]|uniref:P27 family phage terminase small subunit n=1 Tax=Bacillus sp. SLBN-46 TaxID=3042283 RepID=UPI002856BFA6|nr:P27 family phage terminase small subunit [Bacillus sp. SLBN-46]MDR6120610.1 P27 family predicted phage terminase small subunit [Bacillus sp. SLBN-46]